MTSYLITYDLKHADPDDYPRLYRALGRYRAERVAQSSWVVNLHEESVGTVAQHFEQWLDSNDVLFVCRISNIYSWASYRIPQEAIDLLPAGP